MRLEQNSCCVGVDRPDILTGSSAGGHCGNSAQGTRTDKCGSARLLGSRDLPERGIRAGARRVWGNDGRSHGVECLFGKWIG